MTEVREIALRLPEMVMRLKRLGSLHQSRLSFMRILLRRIARENWSFERTKFSIDSAGVGHAVYTARGPERSYSLVAFAHDLPDKMRSDRVIAEAWDATFTLFDGVPTEADITRLSQNVPLQEAGRVSESELSLSRANRSARLWAHVVEALAAGRQPEASVLDGVGYLMRTTAVYGSGKFGAADRGTYAGRPELRAPFQAEMLSVYLTRWFVRDLVEHMAACAGGDKAVRLDLGLAESLGIGNSTGLGMAPFLINHPVLLNNWIRAREEAIRRVRATRDATEEEVAIFRDRFARSQVTVSQWQSQHPVQQRKLEELREACAQISERLSETDFSQDFPWDHLMHWSQKALGEEGQEFLASLVLEPYGARVDELADAMSDDFARFPMIEGEMTVGALRGLLQDGFGWALDLDWQAPENCARVWYVSEEKLEPRLGERFEEPVEDYEQALAPGRDAATLYAALSDWGDAAPISDFLARCPQHRHIVRRVQIGVCAPYGEIRDNTISQTMMPIDMLRAKLSYFGATRFDPRSDRWVRICMFAGAPYPSTLTGENAEDWVYPEVSA